MGYPRERAKSGIQKTNHLAKGVSSVDKSVTMASACCGKMKPNQWVLLLVDPVWKIGSRRQRSSRQSSITFFLWNPMPLGIGLLRHRMISACSTRAARIHDRRYRFMTWIKKWVPNILSQGTPFPWSPVTTLLSRSLIIFSFTTVGFLLLRS